MNPTKKSDVKRHLSTHDLFGRVLSHPTSRADSTDFSGEESRQTDVVRTEPKLSQRRTPLEDQVDLKVPLTPHAGKNCASMKLNSVFLRTGCILPNQLVPLRQPVDDNWTRVEDLPGYVFNTMIRQAGWRLMRIENFCTRSGFGTSQQDAISRALTRALEAVAQRFNAAELFSVQVASHLGIHFSTVTLQPRQIQR
jgi:hypothetical protein